MFEVPHNWNISLRCTNGIVKDCEWLATFLLSMDMCSDTSWGKIQTYRKFSWFVLDIISKIIMNVDNNKIKIRTIFVRWKLNFSRGTRHIIVVVYWKCILECHFYGFPIPNIYFEPKNIIVLDISLLKY